MRLVRWNGITILIRICLEAAQFVLLVEERVDGQRLVLTASLANSVGDCEGPRSWWGGHSIFVWRPRLEKAR